MAAGEPPRFAALLEFLQTGLSQREAQLAAKFQAIFGINVLADRPDAIQYLLELCAGGVDLSELEPLDARGAAELETSRRLAVERTAEAEQKRGASEAASEAAAVEAEARDDATDAAALIARREEQLRIVRETTESLMQSTPARLRGEPALAKRLAATAYARQEGTDVDAAERELTRRRDRNLEQTCLDEERAHLYIARIKSVLGAGQALVRDEMSCPTQVKTIRQQRETAAFLGERARWAEEELTHVGTTPDHREEVLGLLNEKITRLEAETAQAQDDYITRLLLDALAKVTTALDSLDELCHGFGRYKARKLQLEKLLAARERHQLATEQMQERLEPATTALTQLRETAGGGSAAVTAKVEADLRRAVTHLPKVLEAEEVNGRLSELLAAAAQGDIMDALHPATQAHQDLVDQQARLDAEKAGMENPADVAHVERRIQELDPDRAARGETKAQFETLRDLAAPVLAAAGDARAGVEELRDFGHAQLSEAAAGQPAAGASAYTKLPSLLGFVNLPTPAPASRPLPIGGGGGDAGAITPARPLTDILDLFRQLQTALGASDPRDMGDRLAALCAQNERAEQEAARDREEERRQERLLLNRPRAVVQNPPEPDDAAAAGGTNGAAA